MEIYKGVDAFIVLGNTKVILVNEIGTCYFRDTTRLGE